jgi:hypothetical protein
VCIGRHLQCLAVHADASPVVRDTCAGLHGAWGAAATPETAERGSTH